MIDFFVRLVSARVQSKGLKSGAKMADGQDATCIGTFSLTSQIEEHDRFYQMFSLKTNIWVRD